MGRARKLTAAAAFSLAIGAGCASPTPPALVDARASYEDAEQDPLVARHGSVQLYEAKQALDRAESEWEATEDVAETEHLARLAETRTGIARATAEGVAAIEEATQLTRERDKALLAIRTHEADRAVSAAEKARLEAERPSIKTLLDKKLIVAKGRKDTIGHPMMYGTSKEFLLQFGLKDLSELPSVEDFHDLSGGS